MSSHLQPFPDHGISPAPSSLLDPRSVSPYLQPPHLGGPDDVKPWGAPDPPEMAYGIADETAITLWDLKDGSDGPYGKPPYPYLTLIRIALLSSASKRLTLQELYDTLEQRWPYFSGESKGWKNSIRHNLSLNKCFKKEQRHVLDPGKGSYWFVDLDEEHSTPRIRNRKKNKDDGSPNGSRPSKKRKATPDSFSGGGSPERDVKPRVGSLKLPPVGHRARALSAPSPMSPSFFADQFGTMIPASEYAHMQAAAAAVHGIAPTMMGQGQVQPYVFGAHGHRPHAQHMHQPFGAPPPGAQMHFGPPPGVYFPPAPGAQLSEYHSMHPNPFGVALPQHAHPAPAHSSVGGFPQFHPSQESVNMLQPQFHPGTPRGSPARSISAGGQRSLPPVPQEQPDANSRPGTAVSAPERSPAKDEEQKDEGPVDGTAEKRTSPGQASPAASGNVDPPPRPGTATSVHSAPIASTDAGQTSTPQPPTLVEGEAPTESGSAPTQRAQSHPADIFIPDSSTGLSTLSATTPETPRSIFSKMLDKSFKESTSSSALASTANPAAEGSSGTEQQPQQEFAAPAGPRNGYAFPPMPMPSAGNRHSFPPMGAQGYSLGAPSHMVHPTHDSVSPRSYHFQRPAALHLPPNQGSGVGSSKKGMWNPPPSAGTAHSPTRMLAGNGEYESMFQMPFGMQGFEGPNGAKRMGRSGSIFGTSRVSGS